MSAPLKTFTFALLPLAGVLFTAPVARMVARISPSEGGDGLRFMAAPTLPRRARSCNGETEGAGTPVVC